MSLFAHAWTIGPRLRHGSPVDLARSQVAIDAPKLRVEWLRTGGHVAFPRRLNAGLGEGIGLDAQVIAWLRSEAEKK